MNINTRDMNFVKFNNQEMEWVKFNGVTVWEGLKKLIAQGVPPITLEKCGNKNLVNYQIYGNSKQQILPDGYTQLEYIEATGTQYIDTGFSPDGNTQVDYKVKTTSGAFDASPFVGARLGTSNTNRFFPISYMNIENQCRSTFGTVTIYIDITGDTLFEGSFRPKSGVSIINGTSYDISNAGFQKSANNNLYIFATSGYTSNLYQSHGKMYYCKIYDNGTLIRNYIPAKNSSNVAGLYDTVNNTFNPSIGTGNFVAGATAPTPNAPIEIKSVGDKTKNLWNSTLIVGCMKFADGQYLNYPGYVCNATPIPVEEGQTYTISANNYDDPERTSTGFVFYNNGTFVSSIITTSLTVTIPTGVNQLYYDFRKQSHPSSLSPSDITNVQFEKGSTATSYEPYGYNIPVNVSSTNLLPYPYILESGRYGGIDITINDDGSIKLNGTTTGVNATINTFRLKAGTYTISGNPSPDVNLWLRVVGSTTSAYYVRNYNGIKGTLTIAKDSDMYVYITISRGVTLNNVTIYPMVNKGTMNLEYSKYFTPRTTNIYLNEPLRKIGNYIDYIDLETQKVYRNIGHIDLGSLTYSYQSANNRFISSAIPGIKVITGNWMYDLKSDIYGNTLARNYNIGTQASVGFIWDDRYTAPADLKNAVTGHYLEYALNTTSEESITLPDILLNKGTNIISIDTNINASNLWIKYKGKE